MQVRGKVATCLAASAAKMTAEQWRSYPGKPLLVAAGKLVSDNTPEARDSAKSLISILRGAFEGSATTSDHEVAADAYLSVTASFHTLAQDTACLRSDLLLGLHSTQIQNDVRSMQHISECLQGINLQHDMLLDLL